MELTLWDKPFRIIQNNLRAIDAEGMDVKELIKEQYEYGTNVFIANAGGLLSWYDSDLEEQERNPYLDFDYVGQVIEEAHKYDMKVLLRLDVSNLSEELAKKHPDWLRRDSEGNAPLDLGMVQDCFNSPMWESYNFKLIKELFEKYNPDGIFYNAVHYGFCHCDVCKEKYKKDTGMELPQVIQTGTEEGKTYIRYRYAQVSQYTKRVKEYIYSLKPDAVLAIVSNIASDTPDFNLFSGWDTVPFMQAHDLQVSEAVNHVWRKHPKWVYLPGENARIANAMGRQTMICLHYSANLGRRAAQPAAQLLYDIAQTAAFGGSPAMNISGTFDIDDRKGLSGIKKIYNYLKDNSDAYEGLSNKANVALVFSQSTVNFETPRDIKANSFFEIMMENYESPHMEEYRGIYAALVGQHIPFDVLHDDTLPSKDLSQYDIIVLSSLTCLSDEQIKIIDEYVENGGKILVTGQMAATKDKEGRSRGKSGLKCLQVDVKSYDKNMSGGYMRLEDKSVWTSFADVDCVAFSGSWTHIASKNGEDVMREDLYRIPQVKINKPEFAFTSEKTNEPGLIVTKYEKGTVAVMPWDIGTLFRKYSIADNGAIISDLLDYLKIDKDIYTNAPYSVEVALGKSKAGEILHLINGTGLQSMGQLEEIPVHDIKISVRTDAQNALSLTTKQSYETKRNGEFLEITIPKIGMLEAINLN